MVSFPLSCHCSRVRTVTGAGVVRSLRRTREPVTVICSSIGLVPGASSPLGGGSCGIAPGGGCASVSDGVVCAAAIPAERRRIEATRYVVRLELIGVPSRVTAMAAALLGDRTLLLLTGTSQMGPRVLTFRIDD